MSGAYVDVVCAAVIGPITQPRAVVVGLPMHGRLRMAGRSAPLSARAGRDLARQLRPPQGKHPSVVQNTADDEAWAWARQLTHSIEATEGGQ
jgi:hypothetical protein